jgi:hypothetical protein
MTRSASFVGHFGNTPLGLLEIKEARAHFRALGFYLTCRGRGSRKEIFAKTGRRLSKISPNQNDIYLGQPEAKYVTFWAVYLRPVPVKKELPQ